MKPQILRNNILTALAIIATTILYPFHVRVVEARISLEDIIEFFKDLVTEAPKIIIECVVNDIEQVIDTVDSLAANFDGDCGFEAFDVVDTLAYQQQQGGGGQEGKGGGGQEGKMVDVDSDGNKNIMVFDTDNKDEILSDVTCANPNIGDIIFSVDTLLTVRQGLKRANVASYVAVCFLGNILDEQPTPTATPNNGPVILLKDKESIDSSSPRIEYSDAGVYLEQQNDGTVVVGRLAGGIYWQSEPSINKKDGKYYTLLQKKGNLVTRPGNLNERPRQSSVWKSHGVSSDEGNYDDFFLSLNKDFSRLQIYRGKPSNPKNKVWSVKTYEIPPDIIDPFPGSPTRSPPDSDDDEDDGGDGLCFDSGTAVCQILNRKGSPQVAFRQCFPSSISKSKYVTDDKEIVGRRASMRHLVASDLVLSQTTDGTLFFDRVVINLHRHTPNQFTKKKTSDMIVINHSGPGTISITPRHMIWFDGMYGPAHKVLIGSTLSNGFVVQGIVQKSNVEVVNPMTTSGTILAAGLFDEERRHSHGDKPVLSSTVTSIWLGEKMLYSKYKYFSPSIIFTFMFPRKAQEYYDMMPFDSLFETMISRDSDLERIARLSSLLSIVILFFIDLLLVSSFIVFLIMSNNLIHVCALAMILPVLICSYNESKKRKRKS